MLIPFQSQEWICVNKNKSTSDLECLSWSKIASIHVNVAEPENHAGLEEVWVIYAHRESVCQRIEAPRCQETGKKDSTREGKDFS